LLLRVSAAAAALALGLIPVSWMPPDELPTALLVLMPGRYLNFAAMTFVALLLGLAAGSSGAWRYGVMLFLSASLVICDRSMLWQLIEHHHGIHYDSPVHALHIMFVAAAVLLAGAAWARQRHDGAAKVEHDLHHRPANRLRQGFGESRRSAPRAKAEAGHYMELAVLALVVFMTVRQHDERSGAHFNDRTNDVFFADVASGSGVLLVAGDLHLMQLRTRRPVLVDSGALDTVMYSLETGAAMQRILREAYGLDIFNPPPEAVGSGRIPPLAHKKAWERFSPDEWQRIRRTFGVTQVIAYADWALQLPLASQSRRLILYDIPER